MTGVRLPSFHFFDVVFYPKRVEAKIFHETEYVISRAAPTVEKPFSILRQIWSDCMEAFLHRQRLGSITASRADTGISIIHPLLARANLIAKLGLSQRAAPSKDLGLIDAGRFSAIRIDYHLVMNPGICLFHPVSKRGARLPAEHFPDKGVITVSPVHSLRCGKVVGTL